MQISFLFRFLFWTAPFRLMSFRLNTRRKENIKSNRPRLRMPAPSLPGIRGVGDADRRRKQSPAIVERTTPAALPPVAARTSATLPDIRKPIATEIGEVLFASAADGTGRKTSAAVSTVGVHLAALNTPVSSAAFDSVTPRLGAAPSQRTPRTPATENESHHSTHNTPGDPATSSSPAIEFGNRLPPLEPDRSTQGPSSHTDFLAAAADAHVQRTAHDTSVLTAAVYGSETRSVTRSTAAPSRLKDLEPNSVEYIYERHRRRCQTTTPLTSIRRVRSPDGTFTDNGNYFFDFVNHIGELGEEDRSMLRERLLPKRVVADAFDDEFASRLKCVNRRNANGKLMEAQRQRDRLLAHMHEQGTKRVEAHEHRVAEILDMQRNLQAIKQEAQTQVVVKQWSHILFATRFSMRMMRKLQSEKSLATLRRTMLPMIVRKCGILRKKWYRRDLTNARLPDIPAPTPSMVRSMYGSFFDGWSDSELNALIRFSKPMSFAAGEYIMFEGDYDRVMYLITRGKVEVQIRNKKLVGEKRRRRDNAAATFELNAPAYVGEFALLCKEPRSASIQCSTDVDTYVISSKDFHSVVDQLSPAIAKKQQDATDERRRANLRKYFALRPEALRKSKYFAHWETAVLKELSVLLEPLVLRANDRLFREGDYEPALYFIADGRIRLSKPSEPSEPPTEVGPGDVIGAFETFFLQERRSHTAVCKTNCDVWKLTRQQLLELGMSDPAALVRSKSVVQQAKTAEMFKLPKAPPYVLQDPFLSFVLPPSHIQMLWQLGQPRVVGAGEHLTIEGDEARHIFVVVFGSFHISHFDKERKQFDDKVVISPIQGGLHSGVNYTNDNLKSMFPSCIFCEIPKNAEPTLKPRKSFRSGSVNLGSHADLSALMLRTAQEEGVVGIVLGAYEFATRQNQWNASYRCSSMCEVFAIDRQTLESKLPPNLLQLHRTSTTQIRNVIDAFHSRNVASLLSMPQSQKICGLYSALKAQEKLDKKAEGDNKRKGIAKGVFRSVPGGFAGV